MGQNTHEKLVDCLKAIGGDTKQRPYEVSVGGKTVFVIEKSPLRAIEAVFKGEGGTVQGQQMIAMREALSNETE